MLIQTVLPPHEARLRVFGPMPDLRAACNACEAIYAPHQVPSPLRPAGANCWSRPVAKDRLAVMGGARSAPRDKRSGKALPQEAVSGPVQGRTPSIAAAMAPAND